MSKDVFGRSNTSFDASLDVLRRHLTSYDDFGTILVTPL